MSGSQNNSNSRSISIRGSASRAVMITGDNNVVTMENPTDSLPDPQSVDILSEIRSIRNLFAQIQTKENAQDVIQFLHEAETEAAKIKPNKQRIGNTLKSALNYASGMAGVSYFLERLTPHLRNVVAWLGTNWHNLL